MAWFKVDDSFYDHPKVFDAPDCAVALWVRAGSWASRNLTDGFVPTGMPRRLCDDPDTAAKDLVKRGLWDEVEGGYRFHDWSVQQPSRVKVLGERAAANRRQALTRNPDLREFVRQRDANLCRYCGRPVEWKDRRSASGGTFDHVNPDGPTEADNVVVACRGCAAGKGARTPEQAGMQLLSVPQRVETQIVSRYVPKSDLDSSPYPTRPDPTRPVLPTEVRQLEPPPEGGANAPPVEAGDSGVELESAPLTAQTVVAAYIEGARASRRTVTGQIRKQVGKTAKELIESGEVAPQRILDAAREMGRRGWKDLNMQFLREPEANGTARSNGGPPPRDRLAEGMDVIEKLEAQYGAADDQPPAQMIEPRLPGRRR